jgi:uncharacterized pyridoxal phosphate-containing UPF0001 family protein
VKNDGLENNFEHLIDKTQVNCDQVLNRLRNHIYAAFKEGEEKKGVTKNEVECNIKALRSVNYAELRFKINGLMGLNLPKAEKTNLRNSFNTKISQAIENTVDECWQ